MPGIRPVDVEPHYIEIVYFSYTVEVSITVPSVQIIWKQVTISC